MFRSLLLTAAAVLLPSFALAHEPGVLSLSGQGVVKAKPDEGYITVGVVTYGAKSADAVRANSTTMKALFATLKEKGVTDENVATSNFSVSENYKTVNEKGEDGRVHPKQVRDGYVVSNVVSVTVCELDKFGEVLDAVVAGGANQVHGISFGSSKSKELLDEARKKAVADATRKAKLYAEGLGVKLGNIKVVSENGGYQPRVQPMYAARMAEAAPAGDVPVASGQLQFNVTVSVTWELDQGDNLPGVGPKVVPAVLPVKPGLPFNPIQTQP